MAMGISNTAAQGPSVLPRGPSSVFSRSRPSRRFIIGSFYRSFWASTKVLYRREACRTEIADNTFPCLPSIGSPQFGRCLFSLSSGERHVNKTDVCRVSDHNTFREPGISDLVHQGDIDKRPLAAEMADHSMSSSLVDRITSSHESIEKWNMETERIRKLKEDVPRRYKVDMVPENSYVGPRNIEIAGTEDPRYSKPDRIGKSHIRQTHGKSIRRFVDPDDFIMPLVIELDVQKIMHFEPNEAIGFALPKIDADQMPIKICTKVAKETTTVRSDSGVSSYMFSSKGFTSTKNSSSRKQIFHSVRDAQSPSSTHRMYGQPVLSTRKATAEKSYECNAAAPKAEKLIDSSGLGSVLVEDDAADTIKDVRKKLRGIYDEVIVVDNVLMAREIVHKLTQQYRHLIHACDTEVTTIDVKQETPVNHGEIVCFSIYSGPDADYGHGKSCIWVDVLDGGGNDLLLEFAPFFEDPDIKKVWHNYSFDNHVIENYGIKLSGFHADTMHMARLWNASRRTDGGYSLEALTGDHEIMTSAPVGRNKELISKVSMNATFGKKNVRKDGTEGKIIAVAPVEELQREERQLWISYSSLDAISTLKLYECLRNKLLAMAWRFDGTPLPGKSMFDFYKEYWRPFGVILVKMEREGMLIDRPYLANIGKLAKVEQETLVNSFRNWASKYCPDARYMNVGSDTQLRQLLFGGILNRKNRKEALPEEKTFKVPNVDGFSEEGKKMASKYRNITLHSIGVKFPVEMYTATGWPSVSGDALKILAGKVSAVYDFVDEASEEEHLEESDEEDFPEFRTEEVTSKNVDIAPYGTAYTAFPGDEEAGKAACHAFAALCEVCSIDSLISNFILPLQGSNISGKDGRIHCSLNINTETGRLSARRPNLQNQPALEKDRYKIRQAFIAAPGNSLIVADYGQLELRILAHLTNCKSMMDAFKAGGDFHSRTALNMYEHIREATERKEVLLEWYPQPGEDKPPIPLLKDSFASERRKAKMLNFSIAYGKTPMGLARDWKVSLEEARKTVELWYKDRQEVLAWQEKQKQEARVHGQVYTLLGRARRFPAFYRASYPQRWHIERAAINTPVQGSAADVAMCAMLRIFKDERLKELGWKLLLQVHDEVILEGPSVSAEEAKAIVVDSMSKPFFNGKNVLRVDLSVDARCAQNWYAAK